MKKILVIATLTIISVLGVIFIFSNGKANFGGLNNKNEIVNKPEFVASMAEINKGMPTIIMFKAITCDDCVKMEIIYKNLYEQYDGAFNLVYYDAYEFTNVEIQNAIAAYDVKGAPTSIVLDSDRKVIGKIEGVTTSDQVVELLKKAGLET